MAYLIGLVTTEERIELEKRGWEFETPPAYFTADLVKDYPDAKDRMVMVFADSDLFQIMTGPDWEDGTPGTERTPSPEDWVCPKCGDDEVQVLDWVEVNTGQLTGGDPGNDYWCSTCEVHFNHLTKRKEFKKEENP